MGLNPKTLPNHFLVRMDKTERKQLGKAGRTLEECDEKNALKLENDMRNKITGLLNQRWPDLWYVSSRPDKKTRQRKGIPDFVGCYQGQMWAMELKRPGEKPTDAQVKQLTAMSAAGAIVGVVFSVEQALEFLRSLE